MKTYRPIAGFTWFVRTIIIRVRKAIIIGIVFSVVLPVSAQLQNENNFMVKRFENHIAFDYLQEFSTTVVRYVEKNNSRETTKAVIRFCSQMTLTVAARKSVIPLKTMTEVFRGYGFEGKDLIFLRSSTCRMGKSVVPMEIWVINDQDKIPSYREKLYADEIAINKD